MKILITGALGHIGSHLIRRLPDCFSDCEVVMIDNLATQRFPSLFNLPRKGKYRFVQDDIATMELKTLVEDVNVVVHLAAITDATASFERAEEVERVNLTATKRVVDACLACGVPLIMASSTSVYGSQQARVGEDCPTEDLKPQSPYAATKLKEEALIEEALSDGLQATIFRYGTIFGVSPGMRFHTAVNKFCWQAVMGAPLTVWKTAYDQKRPYLDLDDCVNAIVFIVKKKLYDGRVYNVVTKNATVRDITDEICKHIPNIRISFVDHKIMNQLSYEVCSNRISNCGFKFGGNFPAAIQATINLLKSSNTT